MHHRFLFIIVIGLSAACASDRFTESTYRDRTVAYRVGPLPATWRRVRMGGINLVFHHQEGGVLSANVLCRHVDDVPLDVLTNHLLFGVSDRREGLRSTITLDNREALRTRLFGNLDGVDVQMELIVLKKDGCTHDLQLIAGPRVFMARLPDFEAFVRGFAQIPGR